MSDSIFYVACHNWENRYRKKPYVAKIDVTSKEQWDNEIDYCFSNLDDVVKINPNEDKETLNKLKTKQPSDNIDIWVYFMTIGDVREWDDGEKYGLSTNNNNDEYFSVYDENLHWLHDVDFEKTKLEFDKFLKE